MFNKKKFQLSVILLLALCLLPAQIHAMYTPAAYIIFKNGPIFPLMFFTDTIDSVRRADSLQPFWVKTPQEHENFRRTVAGQISILLNNYVLAYYGHPHSRDMGILGRHSIEELDKLLQITAASYRAISGNRGIQRAFYLIYGTVWPEGEIGILRRDTLMRYIQYGLENDILIFIDHQMGRYDPIDSLQRMFRYLHYPNVHLALDPEWRTNRPMRELGHVTGEEINRAQQLMEDYLIANNLPGERMLVIHQFHPVMIRNRDVIRADFSRVRLVLCMPGIGSPTAKRSSYAMIARATNIPVLGFKLFYNLGIPGAGFDDPLMTPQEVFDLNPRPLVIMYQ